MVAGERPGARERAVARPSCEGGGMSVKDFYRTESGTIFRVTKDPEGHLSVELLEASAWRSAPIGMAGLRIARGTRRLTERQINALPGPA